ncbi:MAG: hypothetical protein V3T36_01490, partial [Gammaproteobacteria bacterium]
MKIRKIAGVVICLVLMMPAANAGDSDALIQLDKEWGSGLEQGALEHFLADGMLALDPKGVADKAEMLETAASDGA